MDMDLEGLTSDLGLAIPTSRRPVRTPPLVIGEVRELRAEDFARLQNSEPGEGLSQSVRALRERHHQLAVLLSQGVTEAHCSLMTGYSSSRISILKRDPAFAELLSYYGEQQKALNVEVQERMRQVNVEALGELQHRLDEQPDSFTNLELLKTVEILSDRTGNGKTATLNLKVGMDDGELERLKRQHEQERKGSIRTLATDRQSPKVEIEGDAVRVPPNAPRDAAPRNAEEAGRDEGQAKENPGPHGSNVFVLKAHDDPSLEES